MHDVIIVGGGPAGLRTGALLAGRGWDVVLLEEHVNAGEPVHCTGVLAAEAYDELDLPRDPVLNALTEVTFVAPSGDRIVYRTPTIEALVVDRRLFDQQLQDRARSAGVTVLSGRRVTDVSTTRSGATITFADGSTMMARAAVLACGANYTFQRRLGMGMPQVFLQSAQVECPAGRFDAVQVHFGHRVAPSGFAWVVPVRRGEMSMARVGLMCEGNAAQHFRRFAERVAASCGLPEASDPAMEPRSKMLPLAPLRRTYADRILAVGDAAGLVKATTGGGIYYSLLSAHIAADTLDESLRTDRLSADGLEPYQRAWRRRLGPELEAQLSLRLLANRMDDEQIDELFELAQTDGIMPIVRRTARFNQHRDLIISLFKHPPARRLFFRHAIGRSVALL